MKKKLKNIVLITITVMAVCLFMAAVGVTEVPEWNIKCMPMQICMATVSLGWLFMFAIANEHACDDWFEDPEEDE